MVGLWASRPAAAASTRPCPSPSTTSGTFGVSVRTIVRASGTAKTATGGGMAAPVGMASWVSSVRGNSIGLYKVGWPNVTGGERPGVWVSWSHSGCGRAVSKRSYCTSDWKRMSPAENSRAMGASVEGTNTPS